MTTFVRTIPGTYDALAGVWTTAPSTVTFEGNCIAVRGSVQRYQALNLVLSTTVTLFFDRRSYGDRMFTSDFVQPGDTVEWAGVTYSVKDVEPIAPDGIVIAARIIVGS